MRDDLKNIGSGRHGNVFTAAALYLIGFAAGFAVMAGIGHYREQRPVVTYSPCNMCHKGPVLDTAKKYSQWHKATPAQRAVLLAKWDQK